MSSEHFLDDKRNKKLDNQLQALISRVGVDRKTLDEVFDKTTLHTIEKLISQGFIDIIDFPISTGKEANVFRGVTPSNDFVAVKIYRTSTLAFKNISKYIVGDPRFKKIHKSRRGFVNEWAKKEFKNLELLEKAGVKAPRPIKQINNVLIMDYIGDKEKPAPILKEFEVKNPRVIFDILIDFIDKMYNKVGFVHADLSEYNILVFNEDPYIIDLGQGVILDHINSHEFLRRDILNIIRFFNKFDIKSDEKKIFKNVTGRSG